MTKPLFFLCHQGWLFFTGDYLSPVYSSRQICAGAYYLWRQISAIDSVDPL